jgi:hypothetical protein
MVHRNVQKNGSDSVVYVEGILTSLTLLRMTGEEKGLALSSFPNPVILSPDEIGT